MSSTPLRSGRRQSLLRASVLSTGLLAGALLPHTAHASIGGGRDSIGGGRDSIGGGRDSIGMAHRSGRPAYTIVVRANAHARGPIG